MTSKLVADLERAIEKADGIAKRLRRAADESARD